MHDVLMIIMHQINWPGKVLMVSHKIRSHEDLYYGKKRIL